MASYAVTARIDHVQPRLARHDDPRPVVEPRALDAFDAEAVDLDGPPFAPWERVREIWAQTTFYLFDPESWR